jgi:hypothetical protein
VSTDLVKKKKNASNLIMVFALMHNQFDNIEKRLYIVSLEEIKKREDRVLEFWCEGDVLLEV